MTAARRVLIAAGAPEPHAALEPLLRRAGWAVLSVTSSAEVLRTVRDHAVDLVLIEPGLQGAGVSGVDVVRTLKGATRYRDLPVLWLLRDAKPAPAAVPADGALAVDHLDDAAVVTALRDALARPPAGRGGAGTDDALEEAVRRAAEAAVARYCEAELGERIAAIVREVAREVVPPIAERLIREEIARLRAEHGLRDGA